jgi:hypothetical protein
MKRYLPIISGSAAIFFSFFVFVIPFLFIVLMAFKDRQPLGQFGRGGDDPKLDDGHCLHQFHHHDGDERDAAGHPRRNGGLRPRAASGEVEWTDRVPDPGRADDPTRRGAHDLAAAGFEALRHPAWDHPDPELDEAAIIDGARPLDVFFRVILPLLWPVTVTNIVVQSVGIFNDFTNPLYYLPGNQNATVQLTLYNFQSQFNTAYNLLFTNILLITIPPLLVFLFFNRQIVAGMTAGAVKG